MFSLKLKFPFAGALFVLAVLLLSLLFFPLSAFAARWYVDSGGQGGGTSWSDASPDLALILLNAGEGDEIWVSEGVYSPAYNIDGSTANNVTRTFVLKNGLKLYGGFPPGGAADKADRNPKAYPSVLDGGGAYHTVYVHTLNDEAELNGFTITGGKAAAGSGYDAFGGGIYIYTSPLRVADCVFKDNRANYGGGGVYASGSNLVFSGCSFSGNESRDRGGGGLFISNSTALVSDCIFDENSALGGATAVYGGGLSCGTNSSVTVSRCSFIGNKAWAEKANAGGGGLHASNGAAVELENCTFFENSAAAEAGHKGRGGAVFLTGSKTSLIVVNSTFFGNEAKDAGSGLYGERGKITAVNCIFFGNSGAEQIKTASADPLYISSSLQPLNGAGGSNITLEDIFYGDPLLGELRRNAGVAPFIIPSPQGAAIDVGLDPGEHTLNGATVHIPSTDQRGLPRPSGSGTDLGACELQWYTLSLSVWGDGGGTVEANPSGVLFPEGAEVTISALPEGGSFFAGWE
ncbi:MAG: right-handed parallel beta-helix repeat-containing protein, partial [Synergistaceae bacterium]|nr:right-handed parallel beta-helix repeat-containing protein [Synergistaceae bacterium]